MESFWELGRPTRSTTDSYSESSESHSRNVTSYQDFSVDLGKIHALVQKCGGDLSKFESFYLLKRSDFGAQNELDPEVSFANFTEAVESIMNDATQDAE